MSQQSLRDNQKRVEIGTMAPIDIVQAQAEVASNEQRVIVAEANIKTAQDNLRALILDPGTPDFWNMSFEPTDAPAFAAQAIDVDAAVRNALDKRSDLHQRRTASSRATSTSSTYRNQIMPDVNAQRHLHHDGGRRVAAQPGRFRGDRHGRARSTGRSSRSAASDRCSATSSRAPIRTGRSASPSAIRWAPARAQANLARARLQYEQAQTQLKNLEPQVATQVRSVARNVQTNQQRVASARASRELQEKKLEAEEKKLAAGMSPTFFVFQAQRDLSLARTAEIQAISDYNKSLVDFEAVQLVPLGGGGGCVTTARSGYVQVGKALRAAVTSQVEWRGIRYEPIPHPSSLIPHPSDPPAVPSLSTLPQCRSFRSRSSPKTKRRTSATALASVAWADEIVVVDSHSTDDTVADRAAATPTAWSCASGPATSRRKTTPLRWPATTGFCRSMPTSASPRSWRRRSSRGWPDRPDAAAIGFRG